MVDPDVPGRQSLLQQHPSAGAALGLAFVAAGIAGVATYSEDYFTALGKAAVTFLAAMAGGALPVAVSRSPARGWGWLVLILAVAGAFLSVKFLKDDAPPGVASFVGGCEPFNVHAQNRWDPIGASRWDAPMPTAKKSPAFGGNELVSVDGWVRTRAAYPTNSPPWNSSVWFHLADDSGWVSFAGVRAEPTPEDPSGQSDEGGRPAPTSDECAGSVRM